MAKPKYRVTIGGPLNGPARKYGRAAAVTLCKKRACWAVPHITAVVKLVYRHLARRHHPDGGGSDEKMAEINRAYEAITKERGWRA